jgi:hypothetical protein
VPLTRYPSGHKVSRWFLTGTDGSITSDGISDLPASRKDRVWTDDEDTTGFRRMHFHLFDEVTIWMQRDHISNHHFYRKWQKAVF